MTNWTHRFELKIPSSKNFYHYEYLYIPVEENSNNKYNGSKIKNDPFNVMGMFMGLPRDEFRNVIYPKYDFNVFKLGILKTIAETPATLIYHDDFFLPEGHNGEYVQDTLGISLHVKWGRLPDGNFVQIPLGAVKRRRSSERRTCLKFQKVKLEKLRIWSFQLETDILVFFSNYTSHADTHCIKQYDLKLSKRWS